MDVGAAPGGWTQWLASEGGACLCVAVDPAQLHPEVAALVVASEEGGPKEEKGENAGEAAEAAAGGEVEGVEAETPVKPTGGVGRRCKVVHLCAKLEDAVANGSLARAAPSRGFDLVVCDVNADPRAACRALNEASKVLHPRAALLLTLKFVKRGRNAGRQLEAEARVALGQGGWEVLDVEQLFANGRWERTVVAQRAPPTEGAREVPSPPGAGASSY